MVDFICETISNNSDNVETALLVDFVPADIIIGSKDYGSLFLAGYCICRRINESCRAGLYFNKDNEFTVFGNDIDMDDIIWMGFQPTVKEQAAKAGVENTEPLGKLETYIRDAISKGRKVHIVKPYRGKVMIWLESLLGVHHSRLSEFVSEELIRAIVSQRSIKEDIEIREIERAVDVAYIMHTTGMKMAKEGVVEQEIAGAIEGIALSYGGPVSFPQSQYGYDQSDQARGLLQRHAPPRGHDHRIGPEGPGPHERQCGGSRRSRRPCAFLPARPRPHAWPGCSRHGRSWREFRRLRPYHQPQRAVRAGFPAPGPQAGTGLCTHRRTRLLFYPTECREAGFD